MAIKMWDAIRPCKRKLLKRKPCKRKVKRARGNPVDRLSCLPNDILLAITSRLSMKEAAKTSVLSHRWRHLWRHYYHLNFEDPSALLRILFKQNKVIDQGRSNFVRWVNGIVDQHIGETIDEFRIVFYLDKMHQFEIDKWLDFAFSKQVKRLEINLLQYRVPIFPRRGTEYKLKVPKLPHSLANFKPALTSLCLKSVDVTTEAVEFFLTYFCSLEHMCIAFVPSLTYIKACLQVSLKYLVVFRCRKLIGINLSAPKLLTFKYGGKPVELHIMNSSELSHVEVRTAVDSSRLINFAFDGFSSYFPQLSYLELLIHLNNKLNLGVYHSGVKYLPKLTNLKHLRLTFNLEDEDDSSVLGWTPLVDACPVLEKLTLKFLLCQELQPRRMVQHETRPIQCLKTLELLGSVGLPIDMEMAEYIIRNAPVLKEVIVVNEPYSDGSRPPECAEKIKHLVPQGVELISKLMPSAAGTK